MTLNEGQGHRTDNGHLDFMTCKQEHDDDGNDNAVLCSAVAPCCCSMLGALGRVDNF